MLSAIAARKAKLAAQQASVSDEQPIPSNRSQDALPSQQSYFEATNSQGPLKPGKRGTNDDLIQTEASGRKIKRRKKKHNADETMLDHEVPRAHRPQPRVEDDYDSSPEPMDEDLHGLDLDKFTKFVRELSESLSTSRVQMSTKGKERAWSPSRPFLESADEGDEEEEEEEEDDDDDDDESPRSRRAMADIEAKKAQNAQPSMRLTTLVSVVDTNVFHLQPLPVKEASTSSQAQALTGTVVKLKQDESLAIVGNYLLTVLQGTISIQGVDLMQSLRPHRVFAPRCWPIPILQASIKIFETVSARPIDLSSHLPAKVCQQIHSEDTVILLQQLQSGIEGLSKICSPFAGVFVDSTEEKDDLRIEGARIVNFQTPRTQPFQLPPTWESVLSTFPGPKSTEDPDDSELIDVPTKPFVIVVKGPRRTGKSTFARTLLNRLTTVYRRVAYLECDIGQTEFCSPGMLALNIIEHPVFGPPFSHPSIPFQSHFLGCTNPRDAAHVYRAAGESLIDTYKNEVQYPENYYSNEDDDRIGDVVPLVINTMGWFQGLVADLTQEIIDKAEPTHIVSISPSEMEPEPTRKKDEPEPPSYAYTNPSIVASAYSYPIRPVELELDPIPAGTLLARYSPSEWRSIFLMSYFHVCFPSVPPPMISFSPGTSSSSNFASTPCRTDEVTWNTELPLLAYPPFAVDVRYAFDHVVMLGPGFEDVVPSELGRAMNVAVIALVHDPSGKKLGCPSEVQGKATQADEELGPEILTRLYEQGGPPPDPQQSTCIGLAFIRALSPTLFPEVPQLASNPMSKYVRNPPDLHVLTPVPLQLLGLGRCIVKGKLEIPIYGMIDYRDGGKRQKETGAPYLDWGPLRGLGADRRRVRRNILRKSHMPPA